ncbi:winged helix-turn-helix transcriptional regulator [Lactobacillus johnsonii]|uniref:phosphotransferase n=1 Tax=Lactobacillus johnsonii TaxID=33959 RepID=UPI0013031423|nr:phosphotransferase [Lactobacillus johnsonii]QGY96782.1 winged helix-turn-helix transcriptional regulator [Lactobacillus johnsonii]
MNIKEIEVLKKIKSGVSQRELAEQLSVSLGKVNQIISNLKQEEFIDENNNITLKTKNYFKNHHPRNAVILAAGYGMRMVPINTEEPKGLLEVKGETLIERLISQLHEVGVQNIKVVVGFMKEHYEFLIDKYNVKLVVNSHYKDWNNIYSLFLVKDDISDTYILPCDVWFEKNPFSTIEDESWYLFGEEQVPGSNWQVKNNEKVRFNSSKGNKMIGLAYLNEMQGKNISKLLEKSIEEKQYTSFWEDVLENKKNFLLKGKLISDNSHAEINSYEQLLDLDSGSTHLKNDAIEIIEDILKVNKKNIHNIHTLKKGMTNRSFIFTVNNKRYIMRIPGEGTDKLIDRREEYDVYQRVKKEPYTETILYLNPDNGYKISEFLENTRNSDANNIQDVKKSMSVLRKFHNQNYQVDHTFDIWKQIDFYENLRKTASAYRDYEEIKDRVLKLKPFIEDNVTKWSLCHIDANYDNFLIDQNNNVFLIDWEYAGMQDPDLDIAMYAIYAGYTKEKIDQLINIYYENKVSENIRYKIYAYIAVGGLLWSNWCEYKQSLGLDFGEYSLAQYRYAKEYSKLVLNYLEKKNDKNK